MIFGKQFNIQVLKILKSWEIPSEKNSYFLLVYVDFKRKVVYNFIHQ